MRVLSEDPPGDGCLVDIVSGVIEKAQADSSALVEEIGFYFFSALYVAMPVARPRPGMKRPPAVVADVAFYDWGLILLLGVEGGGRENDEQEEQREPANHWDRVEEEVWLVYKIFYGCGFGARGVWRLRLQGSSGQDRPGRLPGDIAGLRLG